MQVEIAFPVIKTRDINTNESSITLEKKNNIIFSFGAISNGVLIVV